MFEESAMKKLLTFCFVMGVVFASVPSSSAAAPQLTGKMQGVQYLVGTWSCTTKVAATGNMPAASHKGTASFEIEPGNTLSLDISSDRYSAAGFIGYVESKKLWWNTSSDNLGGVSFESGSSSADSVSVSTGWWTYEGHQMPSRDTMTKTGTTKYEDRTELQRGGTWQTLADAVCTKVSDAPQ
jgi:hypothetical protein